MEVFKDSLPAPRCLVGPERTNSASDILSNKNDKLWKYNNHDGKQSCLHMTMEYSDAETGMRWARSYFLTALVRGGAEYMKDIHFTEDEDLWVPDQAGLAHQRDTETLLTLYLALVKTFRLVSDQFMKGELSEADLILKAQGDMKGRLQGHKSLPNGMQHLQIDIRHYNSYGEAVKNQSKVDLKLLVCIRI